VTLGVLVPLAATAPAASAAEWPQFGGPTRDFQTSASGLVPWGSGGPKTVWQRDLGDGYLSIVAGGGVLYTLYTPAEVSGEERVIALDAASSATVWERGNPVTYRSDMNMELIVLDEDGSLGMVTVSPKGLEVQARAEIFSGRSWTAPTLVGTRLYLRDRKQMVALDPSPQ